MGTWKLRYPEAKPEAEVVHQAWSCSGGLPKGGGIQLTLEGQVYQVKKDDIPGRKQVQKQGKDAKDGKGAGCKGELELEHLKA